MIKILSGIFLVVLLTACSEATKTDPVDAQNLVDAMTYVKAKNGLCFGVATIERLSTSISYTQNLVVTSVDCKAAGL